MRRDKGGDTIDRQLENVETTVSALRQEWMKASPRNKAIWLICAISLLEGLAKIVDKEIKVLVDGSDE